MYYQTIVLTLLSNGSKIVVVIVLLLLKEIEKILPEIAKNESETVSLLSADKYENISFYVYPLATFIKREYLKKGDVIYALFINSGITSKTDMLIFITKLLYIYSKQNPDA